MIHLSLLPMGNVCLMLCFYMEKAKQESHNFPDLRGVFWSGCFQDQCCHSNTTAAEQRDLSICSSFSIVSAQ